MVTFGYTIIYVEDIDKALSFFENALLWRVNLLRQKKITAS